MPYTESGLWVPREPEQKKRWLPSATALLTILSAIVSVAALYISYKSLQFSSQANVVAQRAYLSIAKGDLTFGKDEGRVHLGNYDAKISFSLENLGNTPAVITDSEIKVFYPDDLEDYWTKAARDMKWINKHMNDPDPFISIFSGRPPKETDSETLSSSEAKHRPLFRTELAPKASTDFIFDQGFELTDEIYDLKDVWVRRHMIDWPAEEMAVEGTIHYKDVFNEEHSLHWCWIRRTYRPRLEDCSSNENDIAITGPHRKSVIVQQ